MRNLPVVVVAAALLAASAQAWSWEVASYTPSAVVPQLPAAAQAVTLKQASRAPLWWLRRPHRLAAERGWIGVPATAGQVAGQAAGQVAGVRPAASPVQAGSTGASPATVRNPN